VAACFFGVAVVAAHADAKAPAHAGSATPWLGVSAASFGLGERALVTSSFGPELGLFPIRRLRVAARLLIPITQSGDVCRREDVIYVGPSGVFTCQPSRNVRLAGTLSAGLAFVDGPHLLISPGAFLLRTDVAAQGTFLGGSLPLEWVFDGGFRLGAEVGLGAAVGQDVSGVCRNNLGTCVIGERQRLPNQSELALLGAVSLSWAL